jgi:hypothetical protein
MNRGVLLGGVDVFHLMNDRAMRARGLPGNHCAFALELDGRLDVARLDARLARAVELVPELRFRLTGGFPLRPRWVVDATAAAPRACVREAGGRPLVEVVTELLAERVDGRAPWAIDVCRGTDRDALVLRWFHSLVDEKGAERLLRWLGSGEGDEPAPPPPAGERFETSERPIAKLARDARLSLMRGYNTHTIALGSTPILSPEGARRALGERRPRQNRKTGAIRLHLTVDETRAFDERVRRVARLAETSVMVLASARAVDDLMLARGFAPALHVVPVPLSLDPKGECGRLLGNHLTMMMLALDREDLRDEARAIAKLGDQQRAIVRQKLDLGMAAALDFARWLPRPVYELVADKPFRGEVASFVFSNPGAVAVPSFAGRAVVDAFPLPAAVSPPGLQLIFTRYAGRLSALVIHVEDAVAPWEARRLAESLRAELLGVAETHASAPASL